jgi:CDP-diacylglycerol---serine O-phosphatidyltransferase
MSKSSVFIVKLSWVDYLTLSGLVVSIFAAALVLAGEFEFALSLLFAAMLIDAFDGIFARKYQLTREFGRYLDGFVDVMDYLAVPALFLYRWGFDTWYYGLILMSLILCGVVRLAVFNEIGNIKNAKAELAYRGMPVFWSVLFLGIAFILSWFIAKAVLFWMVAVAYAAFAALMVYDRSFYKFKNPKFILVIVVSATVLFAVMGIRKHVA